MGHPQRVPNDCKRPHSVELGPKKGKTAPREPHVSRNAKPGMEMDLSGNRMGSPPLHRLHDVVVVVVVCAVVVSIAKEDNNHNNRTTRIISSIIAYNQHHTTFTNVPFWPSDPKRISIIVPFELIFFCIDGSENMHT